MKKVLKSKLYLVKENESYLFSSNRFNAVIDAASNEPIVAIAIIKGDEISLEFESAHSEQLIKPEEISANFGVDFNAKYQISAVAEGSEKRIAQQPLSESLVFALKGAVENPDLYDWRVKKSEELEFELAEAQEEELYYWLNNIDRDGY